MRRGYYEDPFLPYFIRDKFTKKPPMIHRGMYTRVAAFSLLLEQFLRCVGSRACQVVVLGAGYDTRYFRLASQDVELARRVHFFEVDVAPVCRAKARVIQRESALRSLLFEPVQVDVAQGSVCSATYDLFVCDVRHVDVLEASLHARGFDASLPTLFLSECVLCYISAAESAALLAWSARYCATTAFVIYEMMHPHDPFGRVMLANLAQRGVLLASIYAYPNLEAQRGRLLTAGYARCEACDLNTVWARLLPHTDRTRVQRLEPLDELEELSLLQAHYCLVLATKGDDLAPLTLTPAYSQSSASTPTHSAEALSGSSAVTL